MDGMTTHSSRHPDGKLPCRAHGSIWRPWHTPTEAQSGRWADIDLRRMTAVAMAVAVIGSTTAGADSLAPIPIEQLFKDADVVALVRITGADEEAFDEVLYRAAVIERFKGKVDSSTIYFGPYAGSALGHEYVLFLLDHKKTIRDLAREGPVPWPAALDEAVWKVMYSGFGQLEIHYVCAFENCGGPVCCDHAVSVAAEQVVLPEGLPRAPQECDSRPFDTAWIKKETFLSFLRKLGAVQQRDEAEDPPSPR